MKALKMIRHFYTLPFFGNILFSIFLESFSLPSIRANKGHIKPMQQAIDAFVLCQTNRVSRGEITSRENENEPTSIYPYPMLSLRDLKAVSEVLILPSLSLSVVANIFLVILSDITNVFLRCHLSLKHNINSNVASASCLINKRAAL